MNYCRLCRLPTRFFCCQLNVAGIIIAWLGATSRVITLGIFAALLSRTQVYDPAIFDLIFTIGLTISAVSLVANALLLYAVYKRIPLLMLPFLTTEVLELLVLLIVLAFYNFLQFFLNPFTLSWLVPLSVFVLFLYTYFYLCMVNLYLIFQREENQTENNNERMVIYTIHSNDE